LGPPVPSVILGFNQEQNPWIHNAPAYQNFSTIGQCTCAPGCSGVSRISKLGGTPLTWPEGPMRRWGFWGGHRSELPPDQLGGLGELSLPPAPKKEKNLLGFARIMWPCLSTVGGACPLCPPRGYATARMISEVADVYRTVPNLWRRYRPVIVA